MTTKISITLDDEIVEFIDGLGSNRSRTINKLLSKIKQDRLEEDLKAAYIEQNKDPQFWSEFKLWECTTADGLNDQA